MDVDINDTIRNTLLVLCYIISSTVLLPQHQHYLSIYLSIYLCTYLLKDQSEINHGGKDDDHAEDSIDHGDPFNGLVGDEQCRRWLCSQE